MTAQHRHGRPWPGTAQRQRGAVAVFVAAGLVALVASLLFVIDIGRLYYAQRQLQLDANMAALAGAQAGAGCLTDSNGVPGDQAAITTAVLQSLQNNTPGQGVTGGSENSIAFLGTPDPPDQSYLTSGAGFSAVGYSASPGHLASTVEVGQTVLAKGAITRTFEPRTIGDARIDSVRVTLAAAQPTSFLMGFMNGGNSTKVLHASATAQQQAVGNFSLSSELANLNTADSPLLGPLLTGLLGTTVDADVLYNKGVAAAKVSLAGLEAAANVNNLHDLANLNTNLTGALNILGQATSGAAGGAISGLASKVYNSDGGPTRNYFGDLFSGVADSFNPAASDLVSQVPFVNALDLITALGQDAAVGQGPIALQPGPGFMNTLGVPGLTSLSTFVTITAPPNLAPLLPADPSFEGDPVNRATAKTAQAVIGIRTNINVANLGLINVNLGLDVDVDPARAALTQLVCPAASKSGNIEATVGVQTNLAEITAGGFDPTKTNPPLGSGDLIDVLKVDLGITKVQVLSVTTKQQVAPTVFVGSNAVAETDPPFTSYEPEGTGNPPIYSAIPPDSQDVGSSGLLEGTVNGLLGGLLGPGNLSFTLLKICIVGCLDIGKLLGLDNVVGSVVTGLNGLLTPLTGALDTIVSQLIQLLGLQLGTATVTMGHVMLGQPIIVTNCLPGVAGADGCPPIP